MKKVNDYLKKNPILTIILAILIFYISFKFTSSTISKSNNSTNTNKVINPSNSEKSGCVGFGNESCIDRVRENFTNTGKQILGEEYLDNGQFGISFLDPNRGQTYNSKVSTDCNCKIINVSVQVMR